jgi:hypothetical protein
MPNHFHAIVVIVDDRHDGGDEESDDGHGRGDEENDDRHGRGDRPIAPTEEDPNGGR